MTSKPHLSVFPRSRCIACAALLGWFLSIGSLMASVDSTSHAALSQRVRDDLAASRALMKEEHLEEAAALLRPLLTAAVDLQGPDLRMAGDVVELLALALHRSGSDFTPDDRGQLLRLLERQEEALGLYHPSISKVLLELACISQVWGNPQDAEPFFRRVIRIQELEARESSDDKTFLEVARTHVYLGNLLSSSGFPGKAKVAYIEAVRISEQVLGPVESLLQRPHLEARHGVLAEALANLGASSIWLGDLATARRQLGQATQLSDRSMGVGHPLAALAHFYMAGVEKRDGHPERALAEIQHVFDLWHQRLGETHLFVGIAEMELAALLGDLGQRPAALRHARSAAETLKAVLGTQSHRTAAAWTQLAELLWLNGDLEGAGDAYREAQTMHRAAPHIRHPVVANNFDQYGRLLRRLGSTDDAFAMALRAEAVGRDAARTYMRFTAEREALFLEGQRRGGRDLLATLLAEGQGDVALGWSEIMRSRALVFEELDIRHRAARDGDDPQAHSRWQDLAEARQRLANLYVRHRDSSDAERQLGLAIEAREAAERRLEDVSPSYRQLSRWREAGFEDIRDHLSPRTALLAYVRYEHLDPAEADSSVPGKPTYLALVWEPSMAEPVAVPLGSAAEIDDQVERCRQQLRGHSESRFRQQAAKLRRLIWDPVESYLDAAQHLTMVADGSLQQFPLAALALDDGRYWIERGQDVRYLSAERELLRGQGPAPRGVDGQLTLLSLGGPDFDGPPAATPPESAPGSPVAPPRDQRPGSCFASPTTNFPALEHARHEGRHIAELHHRWVDDARVVELLGAQASETAFKTWAPRSQNLHVATHGYSASAQCLDLPVTGALLGSGLALAGANRQGGLAHGDDGLLTAEEIAGLDLSAVEWAVLSACETGLGQSVPGEGILGLRRAFRVAGVRTLIMSLWPVNDDVTQQWMTALYEARWKKQLNAPRAVAAASRQTLEDRRQEGKDTHPYFWAPFIAGS